MERTLIVALAIVLGGCDGTTPAPTDAGPPGHDAGPPPTATEIELVTRLPGATATIEGASVTLDDHVVALTLRPPLRGSSTTLVLESGELRQEVPLDWSLELAELDAPPDSALDRLTVIVATRSDDSSCTGHTNGQTAFGVWALIGLPEPCGPFGLQRFRLEPGDGAYAFVELYGDGRLRFAETATSEVREVTLTAEEMAEARFAITHPQMLSLLDAGCAGGTSAVTLDFALESLSGEACGGRIVDEARARLDALLEARFP